MVAEMVELTGDATGCEVWSRSDARARRGAFNEASDIARAHMPESGWGTSSPISDAWAAGYRQACREISETLQHLPISRVEGS